MAAYALLCCRQTAAIINRPRTNLRPFPHPRLVLPCTKSLNTMKKAAVFSVNAGSTWPAVLSCIQGLAKSLPSAGWEAEGGAGGAAAALRDKVPTPDPTQYPGYEPPLEAARTRLKQRRRAEDALMDSQVDAFSCNSALVGNVRLWFQILGGRIWWRRVYRARTVHHGCGGCIDVRFPLKMGRYSLQ